MYRCHFFQLHLRIFLNFKYSFSKAQIYQSFTLFNFYFVFQGIWRCHQYSSRCHKYFMFCIRDHWWTLKRVASRGGSREVVKDIIRCHGLSEGRMQQYMRWTSLFLYVCIVYSVNAYVKSFSSLKLVFIICTKICCYILYRQMSLCLRVLALPLIPL